MVNEHYGRSEPRMGGNNRPFEVGDFVRPRGHLSYLTVPNPIGEITGISDDKVSVRWNGLAEDKVTDARNLVHL